MALLRDTIYLYDRGHAVPLARTAETMATLATTQTQTNFADDAKGVFQEVRTSLGAFIESVGADPSQPQEMARRFGLDKTLTWKVARILGGDDTLAAAAHMPGRAGLLTFVEALERAGAPPERSASVRAAMDRFERLVNTHSGDRGTLEIMLGGVSDSLARKRNESFRKLAFQGNSAIWGVQARTQVSLHFVAPSASPELLDLAVVCGLVDFRRLRPDTPWALASRMQITDDGTPDFRHSVVPIDPELGPRDMPLLRQFCSQPLADIRQVPAGADRVRYEFAEGPVGNTAAASCFLGWSVRGNVSRYRTELDQYGEHIVNLNTPVESLVHDLYIHRSLAFAIPPRVFVYSQMPGGPVYPRDGRDKGLLALTEEMIDLGAGPPDCTISSVPRCTQLVESAVKSLGHPLNDFHGFRYRLRYPPNPALVLFRYELPSKS
jgi:hypothetical protein